ncbi:MAG TPA: hypothetical protein VGF48_10315 [Thermoanaerobaculia bacterium]|jgi:hypothetical protein
MPKYQYVNKAGALATIDAATYDAALSSAPDIAPNSGVRQLADAPAAAPAAAPAQPSAGTGGAVAGTDYAGIAKNAGAAGIGLGDLQGLFGPTPEEQKAARDEIARQYGYDTEDAFIADAFKKPSQTTEEFYRSAYEAAGLPTILATISSKKDALNRAMGVVNDNPWYDEAFRRGEAARLQDLAGGDIENLLGEYNLKVGHVRDLVSRYSADIGEDEKIRTARLNYLESAAKNRLSGTAASRALQYVPEYVEGKKSAAEPKKPQTVSVPGTSDFYEYDPATGWKLVRAGRAPTRAPAKAPSQKTPLASNEEKTIAAFNKALANRTEMNRAGSREQFIRQLQAQFPQIDPGSIAEYVYGTYPDGYDAQ